jgi:uncharacterized membrane protein YraQ (UPF0718 family)
MDINLENPVIKTANGTVGSGKIVVKGGRSVALVKRFRFAIAFAFVIVALYYIDMAAGVKAFDFSLSNTEEMLGLIPPIFIFMGLLDTWVPKETFIKYMGENAGLKGIVTALFLGSAAAGPLYIAFPIALFLLKKKAKLTYVFFFLGVWSTTKIPLLLYEISYLGTRFTAIQVAVCIPLFFVFSLIIEKILPEAEREALYKKAESEFS